MIVERMLQIVERLLKDC